VIVIAVTSAESHSFVRLVLKSALANEKKQDPELFRGPAFAFEEFVKTPERNGVVTGSGLRQCKRNWQPRAKVGSQSWLV